MNLRDLVATLECGGKPEFDDDPVMIMDPEGRMYSITEVDFESVPAVEGLPAGIGHGTVWIKVEED